MRGATLKEIAAAAAIALAPPLAALPLAALPQAAAAQEGPSCSVLAQMTVSSWLQLSVKLADANAHAGAVDPPLSRLAWLSQIRGELGCDPVPMRAALDCVMQLAGQGDPRELAQHCLGETGLMGK